jgi:hypothetical protein
MFNEANIAYFDPAMAEGGLWRIYKQLPWRIVRQHSSPLHSLELGKRGRVAIRWLAGQVAR